VIFSSYAVNMNAGSGQWYHETNVNRGFYKRRRWQSSDMAMIGYLFEFNTSIPGGYQFRDQLTAHYYSWGGYMPPSRHRNMRTSNMMYADGHYATLQERYATEADLPFVLQ
jgi:prepilin-type processing-associated H-X9-DG protein